MEIINIQWRFFCGSSDSSSLFCVSSLISTGILSIWTSWNKPKLILTHAKEVHLRWRSWARGLWRDSWSQGQTTGLQGEERVGNGTTAHQRLRVGLPTSPLHLHSIFRKTEAERLTQKQTAQPVLLLLSFPNNNFLWKTYLGNAAVCLMYFYIPTHSKFRSNSTTVKVSKLVHSRLCGVQS